MSTSSDSERVLAGLIVAASIAFYAAMIASYMGDRGVSLVTAIAHSIVLGIVVVIGSVLVYFVLQILGYLVLDLPDVVRRWWE